MKLSFKKISAIVGATLLTTMTAGAAFAANYPAPFVQNGVPNVAIVYGTGSGVSNLDMVQAGNIQSSLAGYVTGSSTNISGENVLLQMPSSYLHLGNGVSQVFGRSVTSTDMPNLLAKGTYQDSKNNDHDYTQKIDVANLTLNHFNLENYDNNVSINTPAVGFNVSQGSSENVLNYTLTFQSPVNYSEMANTNLNLMGSNYYVLSASNNTLTLLDSAASTSLSSGSSTTVTAGNTTYTVSATIYGSDQVVFTVNGQTTDFLKAGDTYKLSNGAYVGVKNVAGATYAGGASTVQFSIGAGKIILTSGNDVQVNSNSVSGVQANIGHSGNKISSISIQWNTGDATAITKDMGLTMPAFDGVKLSFSGMTYPKMENTTVSNDGNTAIKLSTTVQDGSINLDILGMNRTTGNYTVIGKDSNNLLKTNSSNVLNGLARNEEFVISGNSGKVAESHVYKVSSFSNTTSNGMQVTLTPQESNSNLQPITLTENQGTSIGVQTGITLTPSINYTARTVNLTATGTGATFGTLYTKDGLQVALPLSSVVNNTKTGNATGVSSYSINFTEADKNGNIGKSNSFQMSVGSTGSAGNKETTVTGISGAGSEVEVGNSNVYQYQVTSPLATVINYNKGPTQYTATLTYHGGESYGKLYLAAPSATVTSTGALGNVLVKDSEVSSVASKNLIIVGGSCINSAAATALGVAYPTCGTAFTTATGVGAGQFLIKGVPNAFSQGKLALVVAGYDAADTTAAGTYLTHKTVDTSSSLIGTSATNVDQITVQAGK